MNMLNNCYSEQPDLVVEDNDDDDDYGFGPSVKKDEPIMPEPSLDNETSPYLYVTSSNLKEGEIPLGNVVGHEEQKKELLSIIDWFKRSKELKAKGISIPRGVILFGDPGNGKSLLIKEIIRCCDAPVFIFQGGCTDIPEGIYETFRKARDAGHAIIVFDELDLLINKEARVIRALQENLDGVESSDDILVLAATNDMNQIPDALQRNGRLEKLVKIPYADGKEAMELLRKHFEEFHLEFPVDFDEEEATLLLYHVSFAGMKAVVNDIVLRNGFKNITSDMIFASINNIINRVLEPAAEGNIQVAIHEAGHCVMAIAYPEFFKINRIHISDEGGAFHSAEVEEGFWPYDKAIADIKISMAGVVAEKVICGRGSRGCESDLQNARQIAYNLYNIAGYSSCWETLPMLRQGARVDTPLKRRRMEKKIERLLRKCEKETIRYVKAHRAQIESLGKLLYEKKRLKSSEILSCIG